MRDRRVPVGLALAFLAVAFGFPLLDTIFMAWGLLLFVFSRGAMAVMGIPLDRRRSPPVPSAGMQDASASRVAGPGHSYWTEGRHGHG